MNVFDFTFFGIYWNDIIYLNATVRYIDEFRDFFGISPISLYLQILFQLFEQILLEYWSGKP